MAEDINNIKYYGVLKIIQKHTETKFIYINKQKKEVTCNYPATDELMNELLSESNYKFNSSLTKEVVELAFGGLNSPNPEGDFYHIKRNVAFMKTVGPEGAVWEIQIKQLKKGDYKFTRKMISKIGKYPLLIKFGGK